MTSHCRNASLHCHRCTNNRIWSGYDLDIWPLTLKTFSAKPTHIDYLCEFH